VSAYVPDRYQAERSLARAIDRTVANRHGGPILLNSRGARMDPPPPAACGKT
jgi:hypothetical protein